MRVTELAISTCRVLFLVHRAVVGHGDVVEHRGQARHWPRRHLLRVTSRACVRRKRHVWQRVGTSTNTVAVTSTNTVTVTSTNTVASSRRESRSGDDAVTMLSW